MKISLVIPAYNEEKYLGACLTAACRQRSELAEILVINNASTDGTQQVAESFPGVRVINEPNKGLTRARQRGLLEAQGEIVAYIDADTEMPPGWVGKLVAAFEHDQRVVCVSGPYVYHDTSWIGKALMRLFWIFLAWPAYWLTGFLAIGGNFAAKKEALEKIGGFDQTISFYGEDADIARRLHLVGKVVFRQKLYMPTSARRFAGEGVVLISWRYLVNFLSIAFVKKAFTENYQDIR
jgi:glycosyltransferase involved in cell wall biosynthesis